MNNDRELVLMLIFAAGVGFATATVLIGFLVHFRWCLQ